jgi:hypothetical protein
MRSNLTKEQKREAEAAIYGLSTKDMQDQFTQEDIERMRAILAQHDGQAQRQGIREFDLNNPPKEPYKYQEFPKLVYHHEARTHKVVRSKAEEKAALDAGWLNEPFPSEPPVDELDEEEAAEVARLDKIARKKKKPAQE